MDSNVPDKALNTSLPSDSSLNVSPVSVEGETPPLHVYSPAGLPKALLKAIRPHQATKNLFVFAALAFTGELFNPRLFGLTALAFLLFTLTAGSIYLLNDLLDVEQDRQHPRKRNRPIASGALPVPMAKIAFVVLAAGSLGAAFWLNVPFALALLGYFLLQIAYCLKA